MLKWCIALKKKHSKEIFYEKKNETYIFCNNNLTLFDIFLLKKQLPFIRLLTNNII